LRRHTSWSRTTTASADLPAYPPFWTNGSVDRERHLRRAQHPVSNLGIRIRDIVPLKQMRAIFMGTAVVIAVLPLCPVIRSAMGRRRFHGVENV
jgi:hypothetical protein